ncbi:MAG: DUF1624 domain-containing protein [Deltaproteobacteria bacterium]|nr:DUF1624 domain-containing protein [Deltaproteobacteria bacterium]
MSVAPPGQFTPSRRIRSIDAARGTAMFFVLLSHFSDHYFALNGATRLHKISYIIGMLASPTFMIISGTMLGFLYQTRRQKFGPIKNRLMERGFFFLVIGHLLTSLALTGADGSFTRALAYVFITDTIGVCLIMGPAIIGRTSPVLRIFLGLLALFISWAGCVLWIPHELYESTVKEILVGSLAQGNALALNYVFPVLPWFGVYLASTYIGERIGKLASENRFQKIACFLLRLGAGCIATAVIVFAAARAASSSSWCHVLASPYQKSPPGPVYLLFYGGLGLLILYFIFRHESSGRIKFYLNITCLLGQTSFFVFMLQYYVYGLFFHMCKLQYTAFWPIYFFASVVAILLCARVWRSKGLNRYLSFRINLS